MQRYRVNYFLLIGLVVGTLVLAGGAYGIYKVQQTRNAGQLLTRAEEAREEGELRSCLSYYGQYVRMRPDDREAAIKFANLALDIFEQPDANRQDGGRAMQVAENTVREYPDATELRTRLATFFYDNRMNKQALDHLSTLLNSDPSNVDLQIMRANCLFRAGDHNKAIKNGYKMIGYDPTEDTFDLEKAVAPKAMEIYPPLAEMVTRYEGDPGLADRIMDKLIEVNSGESQAHLLRGQYLVGKINSKEEGEAEIVKALEIDPNDAGAIVGNGYFKMQNEDAEGAKELFQRGKEQHPDDIRMYQMLAQMEIMAGNREGAIPIYDEGLAKVSFKEAPMLQYSRAVALVDLGKDKEAGKAIADLNEIERFPTHLINYLDGRLLMNKQKWYDASRKFLEIRPIVNDDPRMGLDTNMMLGLCYERLAQYDNAIQAYNLALGINPSYKPAEIGLARVSNKIKPNNPGDSDNDRTKSIQDVIAAEFRKPEEEQNWLMVDNAIDEYVDSFKLGDAMSTLLRAEVLMRRGKLADARELIRQAKEAHPDNLGVYRLAMQLIATDPNGGPLKALKLLKEKVVPKFGDSPVLRLDEADLLLALNDESLADQLWALGNDLSEYNQAQEIQFWKGLAQRFAQIRDNDKRIDSLQKVIDMAPGELPVLEEMFLIARAKDDQPTMKEMQEKILKVVGSENDPSWLFTEANRLVADHRRGDVEDKPLDAADELIDRALAKRENWHQLYMLRAEVALLRGDKSRALQDLDKANTLGKANPLALVQYATLLVQSQRFGDAREVIERLPKSVRQRLFGRQYAEILFNTGEYQDALESADAVVERSPESGDDQLWYGRFLLQTAASGKLNEADSKTSIEKGVAALNKATEISPMSSEAWLALVGGHVSQQDRPQAEEALRKAQLALPEDQLVGVLARGYELIGRFFDAENLYKVILKQRPDNLAVKQQIATFYLSPRYPRKDKGIKAAKMINEILSAANDNPDLITNPSVQWARRTGAELLAATKVYQNLLDAERLLSSNVVNGELSQNDMLLMAQILAPRPEPVSRLKALNLLEDLKRNRRLDPGVELVLAELYFATGDWEKCERQIIDVISRAPESPQVRQSYIRMLLRRDDRDSLAKAERQLSRLREMAPNSSATLELMARVYSETNKQREARQALRSMLPKDLKKTKPEGLLRVARLLSDLDDLKAAEELYRFAASQGPGAALLYADFIGSKKDVAQAFELFDKLKPQLNDTAVIRQALQVIRYRRDDIGDTYDEKVQGWLTPALREDPESIDLLLLQAELHDLQGNFDDAANVYRSMLKRKDLAGQARAVVLNNLSYMLAVTTDDQKSAEEAMGYVAEAVDLLGPQADILDTRAVVHTALGQYDAAISDLELSVTDNPTGSKYFHKAWAHLQAGQQDLAETAWKKAIDIGLEEKDIAPGEQENYEKLKAAMRNAGVPT